MDSVTTAQVQGRSAVEILTGSGDETRGLVRAYGRLMRDEDSEEVTYADVFWANGPVQLTNDEWWMTRLCQLRNVIIHSELVADDLWLHEDQHHVNHVHDQLLEAAHIVGDRETLGRPTVPNGMPSR